MSGGTKWNGIYRCEAPNGFFFFCLFVFVLFCFVLFCFCFCFCFCFFVFCPSGFTIAPNFYLFIWKCGLDIGCLCHFYLWFKVGLLSGWICTKVYWSESKTENLVGILVVFSLLVDLLTWSGGSRNFQWHISNFSFRVPPPPIYVYP